MWWVISFGHSEALGPIEIDKIHRELAVSHAMKKSCIYTAKYVSCTTCRPFADHCAPLWQVSKQPWVCTQHY
jgi:hypothetical protein